MPPPPLSLKNVSLFFTFFGTSKHSSKLYGPSCQKGYSHRGQYTIQMYGFYFHVYLVFKLGLGRIYFFAGYPAGLSGITCRILPDIRLFLA